MSVIPSAPEEKKGDKKSKDKKDEGPRKTSWGWLVGGDKDKEREKKEKEDRDKESAKKVKNKLSKPQREEPRRCQAGRSADLTASRRQPRAGERGAGPR